MTNGAESFRRTRAGWHLSRFGKILLAALFVRLALALYAFYLPPRTDELDYHHLAQGLVQQRGFVQLETGLPTSYRPPVYPAFLAMIYALFGVHTSVARCVQAFLGLLVVFYTYQLARLAFSERVAEVAAAIMAAYPEHIFFSHILYTETMFTFLLTAGGVLLLRAATQRAQAAATLGGLLWGLAALTRGTLIFFLPLAAAWLYVHSTASSRQARRRPALAFLAAAGLAVGPWVLRNGWVHHTFVLVDTNGGINFYRGNSPWTPAERIWEVTELPDEDRPDNHLPIAADAPEAIQDKVATREALRYIAAAPGAFLLRAFKKTTYFWGIDRTFLGTVRDHYYGDVPSWMVFLLGLAVAASYVLVTTGGIIGLTLSPSRNETPRPRDPETPGMENGKWKMENGNPETGIRSHFQSPISNLQGQWSVVSGLRSLTVLLLVYFTTIHALSFGHSRFHAPLIPFLAVFAAATLVQGRRMWQVCSQAHQYRPRDGSVPGGGPSFRSGVPDYKQLALGAAMLLFLGGVWAYEIVRDWGQVAGVLR
jgi:4-amino-4-deoxy-L-arabinose transferase-like glycosyltransferase